MNVRSITRENFEQVADIYKQGIDTGIATFQDDVPDWNSWNDSHLPYCRIAAFRGNEMAGWAALTPVSSRCVYSGVAEVSIYIATKFQRMGVGKLLLTTIIEESERAGLWTLQSGIFVENVGSIQLHEKCGFRKIGYRERVGLKNGIWKDNVLMEKRSKVVGV